MRKEGPREARKQESAHRPAGKLPVTAVILTLNERRNLRACLESVAGRVASIVVVDSFSSDDTVQIARSFGARLYQREWKNYADQFQWALDHAEISTPWILRLDADERWTEEGFDTMAPLLADPTVAGVNVRMRIFFMGRFLRHGGLYPNTFLRVFRTGARIEQRWMDEHIQVDGIVVSPPIDVIEANYDRQENIGVWTTKHNAYSTREAVDLLIARWSLREVDTIADVRGGSTARRRWLKERVYARMPLFVRPFLYAVYRYVFRLGFLDGLPGFVFCVLQAFWYRFLVDVKVMQIERLSRDSGRTVREVIEDSYGIKV